MHKDHSLRKTCFFFNCLLSPLVTLKNIVLQHEFCKHSPRKQQRLSVYREINTINISATVFRRVLDYSHDAEFKEAPEQQGTSKNKLRAFVCMSVFEQVEKKIDGISIVLRICP